MADITRKEAQDKAVWYLELAEQASSTEARSARAAMATAWATLANSLPAVENVAGRDRTLREATSR